MGTFQKYADNYERGFMGFSTISVLAQSCLGGIAAMLILMNGTSLQQMVQLFFVVVSCSLFNGSVLSQQKPKLIFKILIFTVLLCTVIGAINLFVL